MPESSQSPKLRIRLNLLHPREVPAKLPERFLKWLVSYGRFIVIIVEVVVVAAFLTRFKLDADLDELKRKINLDLPYVEGLSADEALIKQTQSKLALIDKNYLQSDKWQNAVVEVSTQTPQSVKFIGLLLEEKDETSVGFKITATTISNTDLGIFLNNLRVAPNFGDVNLTSVNFDKENISFTITGFVKK